MKKEALLNLTLLFTLIVFNEATSQVSWDDTEMLSSRSGVSYYDYRLHRNPTFFIKNIQNYQDSVHVLLYRGNSIAEYNAKEDSFHLPREFNASQSALKVDLQVKPLFIAEYGDFRESVRTQFAVAPRLEVGAGGFYGVFQWIIPVQSDFKGRVGLGSRPGEVGIGYSKVIQGSTFINTFFGTFLNNRYGGYLELISTFNNSRFYWGASAYLTGRFLVEENVLFREEINYPSGNVFLLYRMKYPQLNIRLIAERFLRQDYGGTLEVFRQFGNTDIGFTFSKSRNGDNAGLFVILPLFPRKFYNNRWFQLRPPNSFRFTYDLRPNTGIAERTGTFTSFFTDIYRFNPHYLNQELDK